MPHKGQRAVKQHPARIRLLCAGRRWRKTTLLMTDAVEAMIRGETVLWTAPTFNQCRIGWAEMRHAIAGIGGFNLGRMEVEMPTGGKTTFRSLDNPDNARGETADLLIMDEAPQVREAAWYEVLRPVISDTGGRAILAGTPKGRNWYWREWHDVSDQSDAVAWAVPTLGVEIRDGELIRRPHPMENPDFPFSEAQAMFATMPERTFRQEFMAEFIEDTGGVIRNVQQRATAQVQPPEDGHSYAVGLDWGKHNDFTVISVLDAGAKRQVYLDRFNQIDYTLQMKRLKALVEKYKPQTIIAERNSMGEPIIEQLQQEGISVQPFTTTNASKAQAIEALALAFERGEITVLDDDTQVAELQAYEATRLPSGMLRYSAPEGMHDDTVMALALAWQAVAVAPTVNFEVVGW